MSGGQLKCPDLWDTADTSVPDGFRRGSRGLVYGIDLKVLTATNIRCSVPQLQPRDSAVPDVNKYHVLWAL